MEKLRKKISRVCGGGGGPSGPVMQWRRPWSIWSSDGYDRDYASQHGNILQLYRGDRGSAYSLKSEHEGNEKEVMVRPMVYDHPPQEEE